MSISQIDRVSIRLPFNKPGTGSCVLYWMQAAARAESNPALSYAAHEARRLGLSLKVVFGLTDAWPGACLRSYAFMLEGLAETEVKLKALDIWFGCYVGFPPDIVLNAASVFNASCVVTDRGAMAHQRAWREQVFKGLLQQSGRGYIEVETEYVVPIENVMEKAAWSAAVIRPHIRRLLAGGIEPTPKLESLTQERATLAQHTNQRLGNYACFVPSHLVDGAGRAISAKIMALLPHISPLPGPVALKGGRSQAIKRLNAFLENDLLRYASNKNDPAHPASSGLSPWLHFGQLGALEILETVLAWRTDLPWGSKPRGFTKAIPEDPVDAFIEELIVRRELAANHCYYQAGAGTYSSLPEWARTTLERHRSDLRPVSYDFLHLENAATDDPYWNAAQTQVRESGVMHGYMRMYWGKKILEWCHEPEEAYQCALALNDHWELDGRDPNGVAGVGWCFGLHDRPWKERAVYGMVRSMVAAGLQRKFDMEPYLKQWSR